MQLSTLDWGIIIGFFAISLFIGIFFSKQASKSKLDFFLSGRNMPWWLLGISMVATTFSADTPALVTDIVRQNGVSGNWVWWAFLLTGMLTVFVYARLWRRSGILTDLEFYELRYSGKPARFLRGFRAIYLGVLFNIMVMASVCLAAIKIGATLFDLQPIQTLLIAATITVAYSALGGLKSILFTDFFQFILAMVGSVWATIYIINMPEIGGLDNLLAHEAVAGKLALVPSMADKDQFIMLLILPLTVQWWASYYPGSEPGGGGYLVQRMLAAKDETHAVKATMFFNVAHYALRPWPWILIGLASLIYFPTLASLGEAFPNIDKDVIGHDLAYSAMLTYLPAGLLGLVAASLVGAFMSTISTHLNWGSSYIIHDVYARFIEPDASEKKLVNLARITTVVIMILAGWLSLHLDSAKDAFDLLVLIGAGTGLIYILRWLWWRINAYSEIAAMIISFVVAVIMKFYVGDAVSSSNALLISVGITTIGWLTVTLLTSPTDTNVLKSFYKKIRPYRLGWNSQIATWGIQPSQGPSLTKDIMKMLIGTISIYGILLSTGMLLYGNILIGLIGLAISSIMLLYTISQLDENTSKTY